MSRVVKAIKATIAKPKGRIAFKIVMRVRFSLQGTQAFTVLTSNIFRDFCVSIAN